MLLKYVDRTWILLGRLIEKGEKEGAIKHIEIPPKEWKMLRNEYKDLNPNIQEQYIKRFKVKTIDGVLMVRPEIVMDEDFLDKWVEKEYRVFYNDVELVLPEPNWSKKDEEKAVGTTELNSDKS